MVGGDNGMVDECLMCNDDQKPGDDCSQLTLPKQNTQ
jgi:hypothetical protein